MEFIRSKYFERELGVPELSWYTNLNTALSSFFEGPYPFNEEDDREDIGDKTEIMKGVAELNLKAFGVRKERRRVVVRKISVSDSESDVDIKEVLEEVIRGYTASHGRSVRPEKGSETCGSVKGKKAGKDLN